MLSCPHNEMHIFPRHYGNKNKTLCTKQNLITPSFGMLFKIFSFKVDRLAISLFPIVWASDIMTLHNRKLFSWAHTHTTSLVCDRIWPVETIPTWNKVFHHQVRKTVFFFPPLFSPCVCSENFLLTGLVELHQFCGSFQFVMATLIHSHRHLKPVCS